MDTKRLQKVLQWRSEGLTLKTIAIRLNITKERVRQLEQQAKSLFSEPEKKFITFGDIVKAVGLCEQTVTRLLNKLNIIKINKGYPKNVIDTIINLPKTSNCTICGGNIPNRRKLCGSEVCKKEKRQQLYQQKMLNGTVCYRMTSGTPSRVNKLLNKKQIKTTSFVRLSEACNISGLTSAQLLYLHQTKIITTKPSERIINKFHKPIILFSKEEMEVIKRTS